MNNEIQKKFKYYSHPNILPFDAFLSDKENKSIIVVRQYIATNLKAKLISIPRLTMIEKKWLVFQILCSVGQLHMEGQTHGDIKPENFLITGYNWVFLSDILPYKPTYIQKDNWKTFNIYFGENNNACYFAPERFVEAESFDPEEMSTV
jgi:phosphoinositide-3-kinase, regulatory subunit 4